MTNNPPTTEGLAAGLAEFVLVPREPTPEWIKDMDVHLLSKYGAELGPAVAREMIANVLAAAPSPASSGETGERQPLASLPRGSDWVDLWRQRDGQWVSFIGRIALDGAVEYASGAERSIHNTVTHWSALATPPQKPGMVTVKPLEWMPAEMPHRYGAETAVGIYRVWSHAPPRGLWFWRLITTGLGPIIASGYRHSEVEAKAVAQADYTARILSAIEVTP